MLKRVRRIFSVAVFFLLLLSNKAFNQVIVSIPDTTIPRGSIYHIPIRGTISGSPLTSLTLQFSFNANVIDIKSASGADNYAMKCPKPVIDSINLDNLNSAIITITCNDVQAVNKGIICTIDVEGLVGPDSLTLIEPKKVFINGNEIDSATFTSGTIKVPGSPIFQEFPEGLGQNYPNPFITTTTFPMSINKPTKVNFLIYAVNGASVYEITVPGDWLTLEKVTKNGNIVIDRFESVLDRGTYVLQLTPGAEMASGVYFLLMLTDNGKYNKGFLYLK
jgi:hypothetical protein